MTYHNLWDIGGKPYMGIPHDNRERADIQAALQIDQGRDKLMRRTAVVKITRRCSA